MGRKINEFKIILFILYIYKKKKKSFVTKLIFYRILIFIQGITLHIS
jgi:hypothetical protein